MSRIETTFKSLDRPALISFIMAGDPHYDTSLSVMKALPDAGADIIELGMPFTDPAADGPVIQLAGQRALKGGGCMKQTLRMVRDFRRENTHTPVVLMGYFNPVFQYGADRFVEDCVDAGVDGLIIVDLPPEESGDLSKCAKKAGIDVIRLLTPTTDGARLPVVLDGASGFLYYVSVAGVTGGAKADLNAVKAHLETIRTSTNLPIAIGFGIRTPEDARDMGALGDGVVVGSALIQTLCENAGNDPVSAVTKQVRGLAAALT